MAKQKSNGPLLATLFIAGFLGAFNANVVSVALPGIMAEFSIDAATAQWLVSGYMMIQAIVITLYPFLSRRFSTRSFFLAALGAFIVGEIGCILAPNYTVLLLFRILQACGGGLLIPTMMGAAVQLAPEGKTGTYLSGGTACVTVGPALAPVVSGVMVTAFGWRACFIAPLALGVIVLAMAWFALRPLSEVDSSLRLDIISLVLVVCTLVPFVYGMGCLTTALVVALIALAASVTFGTLFVRRQNHMEQPYLSVSPFKVAVFSACCIILIIAIMQNFSMSLLLPMHFQTAFGKTALVAGLLVIPPILAMTITTVFSGRLIDRFGVWPLIPLGFVLILAGQICVMFSARAESLVLIVCMASFVYAGAGLVQTPLQTHALKSLPPEENASGVSLINVCMQVAAAIGPALFMGVLASSYAQAELAGANAAASQVAGFTSAIEVAAALAGVGLIAAIVICKPKATQTESRSEN